MINMIHIWYIKVPVVHSTKLNGGNLSNQGRHEIVQSCLSVDVMCCQNHSQAISLTEMHIVYLIHCAKYIMDYVTDLIRRVL